MNAKDALTTELDAFMKEYEQRTNAHDADRWREVVAEDATYWFTEGSYEGVEDVAAAVQRTFEEVQDEVYTISDAHWVTATAKAAVVRYRFHWVGYVDGEEREGRGRGTNTMVKRDGQWLMLHEHLSV